MDRRLANRRRAEQRRVIPWAGLALSLIVGAALISVFFASPKVVEDSSTGRSKPSQTMRDAFVDPVAEGKQRDSKYNSMEKDSAMIAYKITDLEHGEPEFKIIINEKYRDKNDKHSLTIITLRMLHEQVKTLVFTRVWKEEGALAYNRLVETGIDIFSKEFREILERTAVNMGMKMYDLYTEEMWERWEEEDPEAAQAAYAA